MRFNLLGKGFMGSNSPENRAKFLVLGLTKDLQLLRFMYNIKGNVICKVDVIPKYAPVADRRRYYKLRQHPFVKGGI